MPSELTPTQIVVLALLAGVAVAAILIIACSSMAVGRRRIDAGLDLVLGRARDRDPLAEPGPDLVPAEVRFFVSHYGERYVEADEDQYLVALRNSGYAETIPPDAAYGGAPVPPVSVRVVETFHGNGLRGYTLTVPADIPVTVIADEAVRAW